jgi:hypothetical protein
LRIQQTALKAQMQGDQAEATVAQKQYQLGLQDQQLAFDRALLTMQTQMARVQEELARAKTQQVAMTAVHQVEAAVQANGAEQEEGEA